MDFLGEKLLKFLASDAIKRHRHEVYQILGASTDEVYVYYLTPLSNLKSIFPDGEIKCRNKMPHTAKDLSSHNIQKRRKDVTITLARKAPEFDVIKNKPLHECVNFFWNPLNDTSWAFQRNALINPGEPEDTYGVVCIIEMRLMDFFQSNKVYWSTSKKNLAVFDFSTYSYEQYSKFDWDKIFSIPNSSEYEKEENQHRSEYEKEENQHRSEYEKEENQHRSAEFIAFYKGATEMSGSIPARFINRILVPSQEDQQKISAVIPVDQHKLISLLDHPKVFYPKKDLLVWEKGFIDSVDRLSEFLPIKEFCRLVYTFSHSREIPGRKLNSGHFCNKNMASQVSPWHQVSMASDTLRELCSGYMS